MEDKYGNLKRVDVFKWDKLEGKDHYEKVFDYQGKFHCFGMDIQEDYDGASSYSTAVVERLDGQMENPEVSLIKFVKPNP